MPHQPRIVQLGLVAAALMAADSCSRAVPEQQQTTGAADSVTFRVLYKAWGSGETAECNSDDWGWDSVTFRLAKGDTAAIGRGSFREVHLQLVRVFSPDSAWVSYRVGEMSVIGNPIGPWPIPQPGHPELDSIVISPRAVTFGTNTVDAGWYYRVRTVWPWPEPARKRVRMTTLFGKVVDATSGRLIPAARVVVLGTRIGALTDRTGRFTLTDVPVGIARLDACGGCYLKTHMDVITPSDSIVFRLSRRPGCTYPD